MMTTLSCFWTGCQEGGEGGGGGQGAAGRGGAQGDGGEGGGEGGQVIEGGRHHQGKQPRLV